MRPLKPAVILDYNYIIEKMNTTLRIILLVIVAVSSYYFTFWVPFSLIEIGDLNWIRDIVSIIVAIGVSWFVWSATITKSSKGFLSSVLLGAAIVGGIGFLGGFFGPIIFTPHSNQGPLLGLFITGPLGFVVGAAGGFVYWIIRGSDLNKTGKTI
jgi:hypothetical protein